MNTIPARPSPLKEGPPPLGLEALRAFGVTYGPGLVLDLFTTVSTVRMVRWLLSGRRTRSQPAVLDIVGTVAPLFYLACIRPWHLRWGATRDEVRSSTKDDPKGTSRIIHAITINAPVEYVWPWLAQIGQDRAGFYSYGWLENLAGCRMPDAREIHPEWQQRTVGETLPLHPLTGLEIVEFTPKHAIGIKSWGTFELLPVTSTQTRLIVRSPAMPPGEALTNLLTIELPHFLMQRKMLLGIKEHAEHHFGHKPPSTTLLGHLTIDTPT